MKPPKPPNIVDYIPKDFEVIEPSYKSHSGLIVPELIFEYGNKYDILKKIPFVLPYMIKTIINVKISYLRLKYQPPILKTECEAKLFNDFEKYAKELGCRNIGYSDVANELIFSNKKILFKNAIVLTMDMKPEKMKEAPSIKTSLEVWRAYSSLGVTVNRLTSFLKKKGFQAHAGPALGGETSYPALAQRAGLGFIGKHGLLISEFHGPSQRIAVIYTNISNLPFSKNNQYEWIEAFCNKCNRCIKKCPGGAIYRDTKVLDDNSKQYIDYKKCAVPFSQSMGCSVCIKECVFFMTDYEKIKKNTH